MNNEAVSAKGARVDIELGAVLCRNCGELIGTVPTNGVKTFYGLCNNSGCDNSIKQQGGESYNGEASISIP